MPHILVGAAAGGIPPVMLAWVGQRRECLLNVHAGDRRSVFVRAVERESIGAVERSSHQDHGLKNIWPNQRTPGRRRTAPIVADDRGYAFEAQRTHQPEHIAYAIEPGIGEEIVIESHG